MTRIEGIKKRIQDEENEAIFTSKDREDTFWLVKMVEEMMPYVRVNSICFLHKKDDPSETCFSCQVRALLAELEKEE